MPHQLPVPKTMIFNGSRYHFHVLPRDSRYIGYCANGIGSIELYEASPNGEKLDAATRNKVLWHEITHAVLYQMEHKRAAALNKDEAFVTEFAEILSRAVDSARF